MLVLWASDSVMVLEGNTGEFCVSTRPAITGDPDVWGLRPLLFTVFVMMNLIGAADDTGFFFRNLNGLKLLSL